MSDEPQISRLLMPSQAAEMLSISARQLRSLSEQGLLAFINIGLGTKRPTRRYRIEDVMDFIQQNRVLTQPKVHTRKLGSVTPLFQYRHIDFAEERERLMRERQAKKNKTGRLS